MTKLIECVPNISEGRDLKIIEAVSSSVTSVPGVTLMDVDPGADTNRTVITFVGEPGAVLEAAFRLMKTAIEKIDMSRHKGAHPRMGAVDVCPLIPVSGVSMEECAGFAGELAHRAGTELGLPVYLYGEAAVRADRRLLPDIRAGEYEALERKLKDPGFAPDAGPAVFLPRSGVTAVGARDFLLAYNINLNTSSIALARDIALSVRERGRAKRDRAGEIVRNPDGTAVQVPGLLKHCQAAGWYIDEYGYAQVTMNLTNYHETGLHRGFDVVAEEARKRGLRVTGSEVVGLLPKKALIDAGLHYLRKAGFNTGIPEQEILHTAVRSLGLNDTAPFVPEEKVVELAIGGTNEGLRFLSCTGFVNELSSVSMAPGGGSTAAMAAALSAALVSMVANLTHGKKDYSRARKLMTEISTRAQSVKDRALVLIDEDAEAFNSYIAALRLPKKTEAEKTLRAESVEEAAKRMTAVPFETLSLAADLAGMAETVLKRGIRSAASDAGAALAQAEAASASAYLNVMINLHDIRDREFCSRTAEDASRLLETARGVCRRGMTLALRISSLGGEES